MQKWEYAVEGEKARYEVVSGGFKFEHNGCTFKEVRNRDGKGNSMLLGELNDPKGGKKYDVMSMDNWEVMAHNAGTVIACVKAFKEGKKARDLAKVEDVKTNVKTLKAAGLQPVEITAILKSRGVSVELITAALA